MKGYQRWVSEFAAQGSHVGSRGLVPGLASMEAESDEEQLLDYVMLRLRIADGIPLHELTDKFGCSAAQTVEKIMLSGDLYNRRYSQEVMIHNQRHLRLTDPEGFLMSNDCIATVFAALSDSSDCQKAKMQAAVSH